MEFENVVPNEVILVNGYMEENRNGFYMILMAALMDVYCRDRFLELLYHENVMDLIIVMTQHIAGLCNRLHEDNPLLLETFHYIFLGQDPGLIAKASQKGSKPDSIWVMGDKATARETMKKVGVPTVPGSDGLLQSMEESMKLAHEIGFPVMKTVHHNTYQSPQRSLCK